MSSDPYYCGECGISHLERTEECPLNWDTSTDGAILDAYGDLKQAARAVYNLLEESHFGSCEEEVCAMCQRLAELEDALEEVSNL